VAALSDWHQPWPKRDPVVRHLQAGERVLVEGDYGVVLDCWYVPGGFARPGNWLARIELDYGGFVTCDEGEIARAHPQEGGMP
jgi:hypothetical protein